MFRRAYKRNHFRISALTLVHPYSLVLIFSLCFVVLLLAQLVIANKLATDGEKLSQIETETQTLAQESYLLQSKVLSLGSLSNVSDRADKLGLVKVSRVEIISPIPYAFAQ